MDRYVQCKQGSRHRHRALYTGFGPAPYLSYIAAELDGGSRRMTHPFVFNRDFSLMIPAGVS
jgi:hypothetical protein